MFCSRNPVYRDPVGAVPAGTRVHFKITLPRSLGCCGAHLIVRSGAGGREQDLGMFWCGMNGDAAEWWECHFTAAEPGVYFYNFKLETPPGPRRLKRGVGGTAVFDAGSRWQLTVYEKEFKTPEWLAGGVLYQIFPDRFFCSGQKKAGVPNDRRLHEKWEETPDWKPNEQGKITNSDYFGGDLAGIRKKLPYLKSLGVTCLYLNPIFEAHSNHRYNTADYTKIDPLLGDEEEFRALCGAAEKLGIRVLLDGVFNHTGSDSVYFNRQGRYPGPGAYQSRQSPYYPWYSFQQWPDQYDCWWGFPTLPNVNEGNPEYRRYICGENGIIRRWLRAGAAGWRLDVADELPDDFLDSLRAAAKEEKPDALIAGEVWEDASNKVAYGKRRRYLLGKQLDSVMNYPFRNAVLGFLTGGDAAASMETILSVLENYPPQVVCVLMNNIGTHDTERVLTILAGEPRRNNGREWQSGTHFTPEQRRRGLALLRCASLLQYTLPGVPCLYYGDEAGMEGYADPFNRAPFPWKQREEPLTDWYRALGRLRAKCACLKGGKFIPVSAAGDVLCYVRRGGGDTLLCAVNRAPEERRVVVSPEWGAAQPVFGTAPDSRGVLVLPPFGGAALYLQKSTGPKIKPHGADTLR
ncbi:MAG: alpha-amylase family glycosyl hydrolase [Oscillospiraceae bacterium]|nr:alpha-amylase family glycosyl hydrolase [Oscillospiraceae bacterium]